MTFAEHLDALLGAVGDHLGDPATLSGPGLPVQAVRVIPTAPDVLVGGQAQTVESDVSVDLYPVTPLLRAPRKGDLLSWAGKTYDVADRPRRRDDDARIWTLDLVGR